MEADDDDEGVDPTANPGGSDGINGDRLLSGLMKFEDGGDRQSDLPTLLDKFRIPVVGLSYVTEVRAVAGAEPMYVCGLRQCKVSRNYFQNMLLIAIF